MWLIYDWNHLIGLAKLNDIGSGREQSLYLYPCPRGGGSGTALPEGAFPDLLFRPAPTE